MQDVLVAPPIILLREQLLPLHLPRFPRHMLAPTECVGYRYDDAMDAARWAGPNVADSAHLVANVVVSAPTAATTACI